MPRTKSTRQTADKRDPAEKLECVNSAIDRFIFFQCHDGCVTKGLIGFHITNEQPPGSMKHKQARNILNFMTAGVFRGKGKKPSLLAKEFIDKNQVPLQDLRPRFDNSIPIDEIQASMNADKRTPTEKLNQVETAVDKFIFFKCHDGFSTDGRIGFSPRTGPPGSVSYKRARAALTDLTPSQFQAKGKSLGDLAKELVEQKVVPPPNLRPELQPRAPAGLFRGAASAGHCHQLLPPFVQQETSKARQHCSKQKAALCDVVFMC
jgi:hypothetical protein